jgi:UDP-2-acetamido-3-amino-2,3-dideoxy-glucuronate N-acetyltransferase
LINLDISENSTKCKIHPTSVVSCENIGDNSTIWQFCVIMQEAQIGRNCNINSHVLIENDVIIGDNVTVKPGVQLWDGMRIKNNVFIGPNASFTNDMLPRSKKHAVDFLKTTIEKGASIGANATIIGGLTVGCYAMIGAGSVLTKDAPDYTLWFGNPARLKGHICCCGNKMQNNLICSVCDNCYCIEDERIIKL